MSNKSLGNPFDAESSLAHTASCVCAVCKSELQSGEGLSDRDRQILMERQISDQESVSHTSSSAATETFGSDVVSSTAISEDENIVIKPGKKSAVARHMLKIIANKLSTNQIP